MRTVRETLVVALLVGALVPALHSIAYWQSGLPGYWPKYALLEGALGFLATGILYPWLRRKDRH